MNKIETVHKLCQEVIDDINNRGDTFFINCIVFKTQKYYKTMPTKFDYCTKNVSIDSIDITHNFEQTIFGFMNNRLNGSSGLSLFKKLNTEFYKEAEKCELYLKETIRNEQFDIIFRNFNELLRCLNQIMDVISISSENFKKDFEEDAEIYAKFIQKYNIILDIN